MNTQLSALKLRTFRRMFLCHILVIVLTISVLSLSLFSTFSSSATRELETIAQSMVGQVDRICDTLYLEMNAVAMQLLADANINAQIRLAIPNRLREYQAILSLRDMQTSYPFINYIGLHNLSLGNSASLKWGVSYDRDKDIHQLISGQSTYRHLQTLPRQVLSLSGQTESVVSFVFETLVPSGKSVYGAISININASYLQDLLTTYTKASGVSMQIYNENAVLLAENNDSDLLRVNWTADILPTKSGAFTKEINGERYYIACSTENDLGWTIIRTQASSQMFHNLRTLQEITIFITFALIIIGGLITFTTLSTLFKPVRKAMQCIKNADASTGEFQQLANALYNANSRSSTLESTVSSVLDTLREAFLRALLLGQDLSTFTKLNLYNDISQFTFPYLLVLSVDPDETEDGIVYQELCTQLKESFAVLCPTEALIVDNRIALLLSAVEILSSDDIRHIISTIQKQPKRESFSVGIADWTDDSDALTTCWEQANFRLNYRLMMGPHSIVDDKAMPTPRTGSSYPVALEKQLLNTLREGTQETVDRIIDEFVSGLDSKNLHQLKLDVNQLLLAIAHLYPSDSENIDEALSDCFRLPIDVRTPDQLKRFLHECTNASLLEIRDHNENIHVSIIKTIYTFIEEHYDNPGLTIDDIAKSVRLSPGYCARLFRKETGESLSAYIQELRLDKAKTHLLNTQKSVGEICISVGIPNSTYFSTIFKKRFQLSPSQYRRSQPID